MPTDKTFLATSSLIDFAKVSLDYESFRSLARNRNLGPEEKIAFPPHYRVGYEDAIFADIKTKVPKLDDVGCRVVDIGCGCGGVTDRIRENAIKGEQTLVLVDSPEMLELQPDARGIIKIPGRFPDNAKAVSRISDQGYDAVICYSVLHYVFVDIDPVVFIDNIVKLLAPGGSALIGDIPNVSKRTRFLSSANGIAFHKKFTNSDTLPILPAPSKKQIDDRALANLVSVAQGAGCDAYVLPQPSTLPMANRRDDLLILKP